MAIRALIPTTLVFVTAMAADDLATTTNWREALAAEYEFAPAESTPAMPVASSPLRPGVPMPDFEDAEPDFVSLPTMTIEGRRVPRDLEKGIAERYQRLKANELNGKAGLLYKRDFGPVRLSAYSILYVPVMIEFRW